MPTGGWRPAAAALGMGLLLLGAVGGLGYLWGRRTSERESLALQAQAKALKEFQKGLRPGFEEASFVSLNSWTGTAARGFGWFRFPGRRRR